MIEHDWWDRWNAFDPRDTQPMRRPHRTTTTHRIRTVTILIATAIMIGVVAASIDILFTPIANPMIQPQDQGN